MKPEIKYIYFDVAGTLLHKPVFYTTVLSVLKEAGYGTTLQDLKLKHKILSETIHFPDRTDRDFYKMFNTELLFSLGILPDDALLTKVFESCTYLPWEKFDDTTILSELSLPLGVASNFNSTLKEKLNGFFGPIFTDVLVSEEVGVAKPSLEFYKKAIEASGVSPENILYIGDSPKLDVMPAIALSMKPLLIDRDGIFRDSPYRLESMNDIVNYL